MQINPNWRITLDALNCTLERRHKTRKTAKTASHWTWTVEGYYSNIPEALNAYLQHKVQTSDAKDTKEVLAVIEKTKQEILAAVRTAGV